jgi:hypothetical protein
MLAYRVYAIDEDGYILGPADISLTPPMKRPAKKQKRMVDGHTIEVWNGSRRIAKFDPLHR